MTIQEAIKSEKPFKRQVSARTASSLGYFFVAPDGSIVQQIIIEPEDVLQMRSNRGVGKFLRAEDIQKPAQRFEHYLPCGMFSVEDILAEDWEVKS